MDRQSFFIQNKAAVLLKAFRMTGFLVARASRCKFYAVFDRLLLLPKAKRVGNVPPSGKYSENHAHLGLSFRRSSVFGIL
jgi:hypothetical protein